ncbi:LOW QUALITY PROTEIN: protein mono-ADP-ribosyltransferase PARP4 [Cyanocitta cristata]
MRGGCAVVRAGAVRAGSGGGIGSGAGIAPGSRRRPAARVKFLHVQEKSRLKASIKENGVNFVPNHKLKVKSKLKMHLDEGTGDEALVTEFYQVRHHQTDTDYIVSKKLLSRKDLWQKLVGKCSVCWGGLAVALVVQYSNRKIRAGGSYALPSANLLNPVKNGLQDRLGNPFPLEGVYHGKDIGFVAQVVMLQPYTNKSKSIETKYTFSLDNKAAVCVFEAFINGKLITGDIFVKSVRKLSPYSAVVIEITYVTALSFQNGCISFHMPASLSLWQQEKALNENMQISCMLLFQPEFETAFEEQLSSEIIILIACSNSMAGSALHQGKPITLHVLEIFFFREKRIVKLGTDFIEFSSFSMNIIHDLASLKGFTPILPLIATVLVLQFIRCTKELKRIVFKTLMKLEDSSNKVGVHWAFVLIKKAIELVRRQFPSICYQLELGKDWDSATKKILGIKFI